MSSEQVSAPVVARGPQVQRRWIRFLAICLAPLPALCLALVVELAYRYRHDRSFRLSHAWVPDPDLIYRLDPPGSRAGPFFRGRVPGTVKHPDVRVLCLGGSTTYGHGVSESEAWPQVCEDTLRRRGLRAEVLNAGVPGYGTRQLLIRYRRELADLHPQFVVLYTAWNRTGALVGEGWVPYGVPRPEDPLPRRIGFLVGRHSQLFRDALQGVIQDGNEWFRHEWVMDPHHDVYVQDLKTLVAEIEARGQRAALVVDPALYYEGVTAEDIALFQPMLAERRTYKPEMLEELKRKHAAIRAVAAGSQAILIDVQGALSSLRGRDRIPLFFDEMHPTALGNRKVGEIIGNALADSLLRPDPSILHPE